MILATEYSFNKNLESLTVCAQEHLHIKLSSRFGSFIVKTLPQNQRLVFIEVISYRHQLT